MLTVTAPGRDGNDLDGMESLSTVSDSPAHGRPTLNANARSFQLSPGGPTNNEHKRAFLGPPT